MNESKPRRNAAWREPVRAVMEAVEQRLLMAADPVISEFMASNNHTLADQDGDYSDWIEIQNPTAAPINLAGYTLTDTAANHTKWAFPAVTLQPNAFLVVFASNKNRAVAGQQLHTNFKISADGGYLALFEPGGTVAATEYNYPAQTTDVSFGFGQNVTTSSFLAQGSPDRVLIPTSTTDMSSWLSPGFDDSAWTAGTTGVGYERDNTPGNGTNYTPFIGTDVTAMFGVNTSALIRIPFTATNPAALSALTLKMKYDDGFAAYLNGTLVASRNAGGTLVWNSAATGSHDDPQAVVDESIDLTSRINLLNNGANILEIQGLNVSSGSSDFLISPTLSGLTFTSAATSPGFLPTPTPGSPNVSDTINQGPVISDVTQPTTQPADADNIVITAKVQQAAAPVTNVTLNYRVNFASEVQLQMFDDGAHGDGPAGDGIYGATIPASASSAGQMVRWYVTATDSAGKTSRAPLHASADSPEYFGVVVKDSVNVTTLPRLLFFAADTANVTTRTGTRCSIWYNGEFYDNVSVRDRGGNSTDGIKLDFNPGFHFRWSPDQARVDEVNFNYHSASDESNIRAILSFDVFQAAGVPSLIAQAWRFDLNGAFWKEGTFIENVDEDFLSRVGLDPEGALYKLVTDIPQVNNAGAFEKKTRQNESNADLQAFINGIHQSGTAQTNYILDNFDVDGFINYWAINQLVGDTDDIQKNYYLYRDTEGTGIWKMIPWDKDLTFGKNFGIGDYNAHDPQTHPLLGDSNHPKIDGAGAYNFLIDALLKNPTIKQMYLRRLRTVMDQFLQPTSTPVAARYFEADIDRIGAQILGDSSSVGFLGGAANFQAALDRIKNLYLPVRRQHLFVDHSTNAAYPDFAGIPASQVANPVITIGAIDYNPASGNQAQEYIQLLNPGADAVDISGWTLSGAVDFTFPAGSVIAGGGALYVAKDQVAFRARSTGPSGGQGLYIVGDYSGQLSARGETIVLSDLGLNVVNSLAYTGSPTAAQDALRVTEINYHPYDAPGNTPVDDEFEFIEVQNISGASINLNGVKFTDGINYTFGNINLAAGAYIVVARDPASFIIRYGNGINLASGGFDPDNLSNGGEQLQLQDSVGETILDFHYDALWYPNTDGAGKTLVIVDPNAAPGAWGDKGQWRESTNIGGSPGMADPAGDTTAPTVDITDVAPDPRQTSVGSIQVVFSEPVDHFDLSELSLSRDGGPNLLTASQALSTLDGITWTLSGLDPLTLAQGHYVLTLAPGDIADLSANPLAAGATEDFTVTDTTLTGTPGDDTYLLRTNPGDSTLVDVSINGTPAGSVPRASLTSLRLLGQGGADTLDIDLSSAGPSVALSTSSDTDFAILLGGMRMTLSGPASFSSLHLFGSAELDVAAGGGNTLALGSLSFGGTPTAPDAKLDLNDNMLVVQAGDTSGAQQALADTLLQLAAGRGAGNFWRNNGLASGFAGTQGDGGQAVGLGARLNDDGSGQPIYTTFGGQPVDAHAVLVRYTYEGDLTLDGNVDADDTSLLIAGFNAQPASPSWADGDLNYDGLLNADDVSLFIAGFGSAASNGPLAPPNAQALQGDGATESAADGGGGASSTTADADAGPSARMAFSTTPIHAAASEDAADAVWA